MSGNKPRKRKNPDSLPPRNCATPNCHRWSSGPNGLCIVCDVLATEAWQRSVGRPEAGHNQLGSPAPSSYSQMPPPAPSPQGLGYPSGPMPAQGGYGGAHPQVSGGVQYGSQPQTSYLPQTSYQQPPPSFNSYPVQSQTGPNYVGAPAAHWRQGRRGGGGAFKNEFEEGSQHPAGSLDKKAKPLSGRKAEADAFNTRVARGTWTFQDYTKTYPGRKYPEESWAKPDVCQAIVNAWATSDASVQERMPRPPFQWKGRADALLSEPARLKWRAGRASFYRGLLEQPALTQDKLSFRHNPVSEADAKTHLTDRSMQGLELGSYEYPKDILSLWRWFQTSIEFYAKARADKKAHPDGTPATSYRLAAKQSADAWTEEAVLWMMGFDKTDDEVKALKNNFHQAWGRLISTALVAYYERVVAIQVDALKAVASTLAESGCYSKSGDLLEGKKHDPWVMFVLKEDTQGALLALHTMTAVYYKTAAWWKADLEKRLGTLIETTQREDPPITPILDGFCQVYAEISRRMPEFGTILQPTFVLPPPAEEKGDANTDGANGGG